MADAVITNHSGVYHLTRPPVDILTCPLVIDSPHSGTVLPPDFQPLCDLHAIRASEDTLVDRLIQSAPHHGATILTADFTRTYIDLNRSLEDIDPALCVDPLPWKVHPTKRTQFGLGLIHTQAHGQPIYDAPLTASDIVQRVQNYYEPYYNCLHSLVTETQHAFGHVLHLDVHAMPSMNIDGKLLPDIVIGDLDGTSSHRIWRDTVRDLFKQAGFVVAINTPYKGVEIIRRTGKPRHGQHALQIEINKALYLDEQTLQPHHGMEDCLSVMESIWHALSELLHDASPNSADHNLAAE